MKRIQQIIFLISLILIVKSTFSQSVSINKTGSSADASAIFDVADTTKGILIPRMTENQRDNIVLPATSLLIYQSDGTPGFYYNSGTPALPVWTMLGSGGGSGGSHYVGEYYGGGIVYYVYDNGNHGLIVAFSDQNSGSTICWDYNGSPANITAGNGSESWTDGAANTAAIVSQLGTGGNYAARKCDEFVDTVVGNTDWYLPSIWELKTLFNDMWIINYLLENDGNTATKPITNTFYWSSTERTTDTAFDQYFYTGSYGANGKGDPYKVRAVRKF